MRQILEQTCLPVKQYFFHIDAFVLLLFLRNITNFKFVGKSKKVRKAKKVRLLSQDEDVLEDNEVKQDEVYEISSGDEDSSQGMKSMNSS